MIDGVTDNRSDVLQIGEVAARTGLSIRSLRHWDALGVVSPSARSAGGFRLYTDDDVARLELVLPLKPLGFSLEETAALLRARDDGDAAQVAAVRARVLEQVEVLRGQLERAEQLAAALGRTP